MVEASQGEVWWADLPEPVGSAPGLPRPVVVVQGDALNRSRIATAERLALVEEILDSIAADSTAISVTDAQRVELDRRIVDQQVNPDDVVLWSEVRNLITERLDNA